MEGHDSYLVKVDGSNRVTKHNQQFLCKLSPYTTDTDDFYFPTPLTMLDPPVPCSGVPDTPADTPLDHQCSSPTPHQDPSGPETGPAPWELKNPPPIKVKFFKTTLGWSPSPNSPVPQLREPSNTPSLQWSHSTVRPFTHRAYHTMCLPTCPTSSQYLRP